MHLSAVRGKMEKKCKLYDNTASFFGNFNEEMCQMKKF
jgi:hypothetical protein